MFDIPKLFMLGGPDNATLTTSVFIYNQAFSGSYMYNRAAAASMIMFVIICALSTIIFIIMRDKDDAELRKQLKKQKKDFKNNKGLFESIAKTEIVNSEVDGKSEMKGGAMK